VIVLSPQEVMSLYLYGKIGSQNKLDPNIVDGPGAPQTTVDRNQYMDTGPGRFVTAKDFDYVRNFFEGSYFYDAL
jgi:hypothetical protein